jgi:hypothetical protein
MVTTDSSAVSSLRRPGATVERDDKAPGMPALRVYLLPRRPDSSPCSRSCPASASRRKVFLVHLRNIRSHRDSFQEVYPDEGDVNLVEVVRALHVAGYDGMIAPDHMPRRADDGRSNHVCFPRNGLVGSPRRRALEPYPLQPSAEE